METRQKEDKGYNSYTNSSDYTYRKVFKKGSPLEWFNLAGSLEVVPSYETAFGGVFSQWVDELSFNIPYNPSN